MELDSIPTITLRLRATYTTDDWHKTVVSTLVRDTRKQIIARTKYYY